MRVWRNPVIIHTTTTYVTYPYLSIPIFTVLSTRTPQCYHSTIHTIIQTLLPPPFPGSDAQRFPVSTLVLCLHEPMPDTFLYCVDGIQVHKVMTVSQSKACNVWIDSPIYSTVCTGCTWTPLTCEERASKKASRVSAPTVCSWSPQFVAKKAQNPTLLSLALALAAFLLDKTVVVLKRSSSPCRLRNGIVNAPSGAQIVGMRSKP
jgi:hypothetical protein